MGLFYKIVYEKSGEKKVPFQWITCFFTNAGVDRHAPYDRCSVQEVMKNISVYTVRKKLVKQRRGMPMCMRVSALACWGQAVPSLPPEGSLHFFFGGAAKGKHGCCISSDEILHQATEFLQRERTGSTRWAPERHGHGSGAFAHCFVLTGVPLSAPPLLQWGGIVRKGTASLEPASCAKLVPAEILAVQCNLRISVPS